MNDITLSTGELVELKVLPTTRFRGVRLPGSLLHQAARGSFSITLQVFDHALFNLSHRHLYFEKETKMNWKERSASHRMNMVLTGELTLKGTGGMLTQVLAGQYQVTDQQFYQGQFVRGQGCSYVSVSFAPELIRSLDLQDLFQPSMPKLMPSAMRELLDGLLDHHYDQQLRKIFYENTIRELLFIHLAAPVMLIPGEMTTAEIAAIYHADRLMAENLNEHFTIQELARKAHTNAFVLKRGFQLVFNTGVFGRLLQRRMEKAKFLLEQTNKPIQEVSELSGYETVAGFITSFRKRYGVTPKDWRKQQRSGT